MSDTPNNPANSELDPPDDSNQKNSDLNYELITSYIDNEIKDENELNQIKELIEKDQNYKNRYELEKSVKELCKSRLGEKIETPLYLYTNIGKSIDDYIKKTAIKPSVYSNKENESFINHRMLEQKSNLKRNFAYASVIFILLVVSAFAINSFLIDNETVSEYAKNDIVTISREAFDKFQSGNVNVQFETANADELAEKMNKHLDFRVFIPDVKDAVLIGGVCNEINGEKIAHIIHRAGNKYIYTFQASMNKLMRSDKIIICDKVKSALNSGENWITCINKLENTSTVMWQKDNVICSSLAGMESSEIKTALTNYKLK
ncbi:MAG TPA: hypothetical protein PK536_00845 [Ignavibacteria bacterium]|nr:hypothetical protein [Ignavibacteria bacterium]HRJ99170.1 hypothetical protein [Ignavibacteria bacterium]